jgi:hypothetical protein
MKGVVRMIKKLLASAVLISSLPVLLFADAVSPASYSADVDVGGSVTFHKTVTITETPTSAKVDVMFLTDATGSMSGTINSVRTNASSILSSVAGLGDVAFSVGSYRDAGDAYVFRSEQNITTNQTAVQAALNTWTAGGGGDWEEADLYALQQSAENTAWRDGSTRILVWFGDAASHDPAHPTSSAVDLVPQADAISALNAQNIHVQAINVASPGSYYNLDTYGQASAIAAATEGQYYSTFNSSAVVSEISSAITDVFASYSSVSLGVEGADNVTVTTTDPITGSFDRSATREFGFDVTVKGVTEGVDDFKINALVDGGIVATESDHFTVSGGSTSVPEPGSMALLSIGLLSLAGYGIRRKK